MINIHLYIFPLANFFIRSIPISMYVFVMPTLEIVPTVDECITDLDVHSKVDDLYKDL